MLCNKTLDMFGWISTNAEFRKLFLQPEMLERLVRMVLHVVSNLVGKKSVDLKVNNPEQYNFQPKTMLKDLAFIFSTYVGERMSR